jgi:radical SAM superfamily enzyme YgiQ (UPF0313 family)
MKKNVYFLQINISDDKKSSYLPYAAGCLVAYLRSCNGLNDEYDFKDPIFFRDSPEKIVETMEKPFFVGISCALWNTEYNKTISSLIKKKYPECIIALGGHNIGRTAADIRNYPNSDILISGEGEVPLEKLLNALKNNSDFSEVPNITYQKDGEILKNQYISDFDLSDYPSPYVSGVFDEIIKNNPQTCFDIILETNRGCPYLCAYCDWCYTKKIRQFPIERVKADIEWIARNRFEYLYCADANFGILDRDVDIAEFVIEMKNKYGFPKVFRPTYAKDSNENVFKASKMLNDNGLEKGVTISYQTMSAEAQKNIGRSNITIENFHRLWELYNSVGIPTYTELILGLPGETYESFSDGICKLLEAGQHNSLSVYICQVYKNSPLADKEYMKKYGIKTVRSPLHSVHSDHIKRDIQEYFNLVYQTNTMPYDDWRRAYMFSICVQTFHHFGILRCFAIYLRYEKNISYNEFYGLLLNFILDKSNAELYSIFGDYYERLLNMENDSLTDNEVEKGGYGWYFEEGAFLRILRIGDDIDKLLRPFLKSFDIDDDLYAELADYQRKIIRRVNLPDVEIKSEYDFYSYFESVYSDRHMPLKKRKTIIHLKSKKTLSTLSDYSRFVILQGRRRGAAIITNSKDEIEVTYPEN